MLTKNKLDKSSMLPVVITMLCFFFMLSCIYILWQGAFLLRYRMITLAIVSALVVFLYLPLSYGIKRWYCISVNRTPHKLTASFAFLNSFSLYAKALFFKFMKIIVTLFMLCMAFLPFSSIFIALIYIILTSTKLDVTSLLLAFLSLITFICGSVLFVRLRLNVFLYDYLFALNKKISLFSCFKLSKHLIKGKKFDIIKIHLSCWWVYLLCLTVIGGFFAYPFLQIKLAYYVSTVVSSDTVI